MWKPVHFGVGCSSPVLLYHICNLARHCRINDNINAAVNRMYVYPGERPHMTLLSYIFNKNDVSRSKHVHNNHIQGLSTVFNETICERETHRVSSIKNHTHTHTHTHRQRKNIGLLGIKR